MLIQTSLKLTDIIQYCFFSIRNLKPETLVISENKLIRIWQGVYARTKISSITNKPVPEKNLRTLAITALKKSGVNILPTRMEKEYNEGKSTKVPTGLVIGVNKRVSKKIGFNGRYIKYVKVSQS